jgi:hypothetical protein
MLIFFNPHHCHADNSCIQNQGTVATLLKP